MAPPRGSTHQRRGVVASVVVRRDDAAAPAGGDPWRGVPDRLAVAVLCRLEKPDLVRSPAPR